MKTCVRWALVMIMTGWFGAAPLQAMDIEIGGGSTFNRAGNLDDSGVIQGSLITQTDSLFPTEWTAGYIMKVKKKSDNEFEDREPVFFGGVGKRLEWKVFILGIGVIVVDQTSDRLSSAVNFKSELGLRLGPVVAMVQHLSNAGLKGKNHGENFYSLGLRLPLNW